MKKKIFIPIYRSFGLRYLISTKLIENLSKEHEVIIFIDFKKLNYYKYIFKNINVTFEDIKVANLEQVKKKKLYNFIQLLRKFTCGENNNYKNNSIKVWKIKYKEEIKKKKFYLIYPLSFFLRKFFFLRYILNLLEKKIFDQKFIKDYFYKYSPSLLITTSYGYDYDQYFVNNANKFNCKTLSIIYSWDNPTSKGYKCSDSDIYFVWNKNMKNELINFHDINKSKIKICGIAHWDTFFNDLKEKKILKNFFMY